MNKTELSRDIASKMHISKKQALKFINVFQDLIQVELEQKNQISLHGFGTFTPWEQTERKGRNPRNGVPYVIHQRTSVKFKPGLKLLNSLNSLEKKD